MRPELPQPAREALARQTAGEAHPAPELLNAYLEQALASSERTQVLTHLASCAECREVVFLAGGCVDEPVNAPSLQPVRSWQRWRWAVPIAALALIASAVVVQHRRATERMAPMPVTIGTSRTPELPAPHANTPVEAVSNLASPSTTTMSKPSAKATSIPAATSRHPAAGGAPSTDKLAQPAFADKQASAAVAGQPADAARTLEIGAAPKPADTSPSSLISVAPAVPAIDPRSGFRATAPPAVPVQPSAPGMMSRAGQVQIALRAHWRITSDGHLERSVAGEDWTRVLADQPVVFRVVSITANNVWAGGSKGALFRSRDGGRTWEPVPLTSGGSTEDSNIVGISFETPQQGVVTAEAGGRWATTDGGQTWTKQ